ncbi:MAG: guanylate kinase [Alphaproteobacteria bacterium]|nr:guanylate kinase [Alphaproteobacteria bacterium]
MTQSTRIPRRGVMFVLSSPSGAGKTTISRRLIEAGLRMSVSVTTRKMRPGEVDGKDYWFISPERFAAMVRDGELLEHATVYGYSYGTPRTPVEAALARGEDVLFDVDWQGTQQLRQAKPGDVVSVFVLPPSLKELERRLRGRGQDSEETVRRRLARAPDDMSHWAEYDYILVNDDLEDCVRRVQGTLEAERQRRDRLLGVGDFVRRLAQN